MRTIYLHGFASSPASRKARLFVEKLAQRKITVEAPELGPDFEHLTLTSQLAILDRVVAGQPACLIGSSMGGYLAALYAAGHPEIQRLVLLAPAFAFYQLWVNEMGPEKLDQWRKNGTISVFHYGAGHNAPLNYGLMEDARTYPPFPDFPQLCLLLHGLKDTVVPFAASARFAAGHPNVKLISFNSGHELTDVLDEIWNVSSTFLLGNSTERV